MDVTELGVDLLAFTGHKMLGPTGIGILWGRYDLLDDLPPFLGGGEMIEVVRMTGSTYAKPPHRFEAGTPPIAQLTALAVAADYLDEVGMAAIAQREHRLAALMLEGLGSVPGVHILGPTDATARTGTVSFTVDGVHPHDAMSIMDGRGVAVRGGHHCAGRCTSDWEYSRRCVRRHTCTPRRPRSIDSSSPSTTHAISSSEGRGHERRGDVSADHP